MGIGMKRRRKDFIYAKQIFELIGYFFEEIMTQKNLSLTKIQLRKSLKSTLQAMIIMMIIPHGLIN